MNAIETATAGWYNAFYLLAIATAAGTLQRGGRDRGLDPTRWSIAILGWIVGGVIGSMIPHQVAPTLIPATKTMLGGIAGATLGLVAVSAWLRLPVVVSLDLTAVALPLGAAVARIGCYLTGCCRGIETGVELFPRHPVQLYEAVLAVCFAAAIHRRHQRLPRGSAFLISVAGVGSIRFATEFLRDSERAGPLSVAQWIVIPVVLAALAALRWRGELARAATVRPPSSVSRPAIMIAAVVTVSGAASSLSPLEVTAIGLAIVATIAMVARARRAAPIGMAAILLQAPAAPRTLFHVGGGSAAGLYTTTHRGESCSGEEIERWTRRSTYMNAGVEAGIRRERSRTSGFGLRIGGMGGVVHSGAAQVSRGAPYRPGAYDISTHGVSIIGDYDWRRFGFSIGGSYGRFATVIDRENGALDPSFDRLLALGIRVGPKKGTSLELRVGDNAPTWSPAPAGTLALGFGDSLGNRLRVGVSETGAFVAASRRVGSRVELLPFAAGLGVGTVASSIHAGLMVRRWFDAR